MTTEPSYVMTVIDMRSHILKGDMNLELSHAVRVAVNGFLVIQLGLTIEEAQAKSDAEVVALYKQEFLDDFI